MLCVEKPGKAAPMLLITSRHLQSLPEPTGSVMSKLGTLYVHKENSASQNRVRDVQKIEQETF